MVKVYENNTCTEYTAEEWYGVAEETFTVKCDEIGFEQSGFHSFDETRQFVESNDALMNANKFTVIEEKANGETKVHEYFKIVIGEGK